MVLGQELTVVSLRKLKIESGSGDSHMLSLAIPKKNQRGSRTIGTPVESAEESGDYFSPFSTIFTLSFRLAWAAASLATGIR